MSGDQLQLGKGPHDLPKTYQSTEQAQDESNETQDGDTLPQARGARKTPFRLHAKTNVASLRPPIEPAMRYQREQFEQTKTTHPKWTPSECFALLQLNFAKLSLEESKKYRATYEKECEVYDETLNNFYNQQQEATRKKEEEKAKAAEVAIANSKTAPRDVAASDEKKTGPSAGTPEVGSKRARSGGKGASSSSGYKNGSGGEGNGSTNNKTGSREKRGGASSSAISAQGSQGAKRSIITTKTEEVQKPIGASTKTSVSAPPPPIPPNLVNSLDTYSKKYKSLGLEGVDLEEEGDYDATPGTKANALDALRQRRLEGRNEGW
ncbi:uncharacterized protein JCM6883_001122 [Sporobolomyces salmoneus]|uniref:uncharacterized protein n=1 Tax=Sporobolomyces salmoneus TaxID=183962 RepID=UPI0031824359